jgi:hypothetical protein
MKKFIFLAGLGIGFVIGSRAGRGPYESLERTARQVADDPEVQRRAAQAKDTASRVAQDTAANVKEKAPEVAETVKDKAPEVAAAAQTTVAGAADAAKHRLSNRADATPDAEAEKIADASADSAAAGGDAEVGEDKPLSS